MLSYTIYYYKHMCLGCSLLTLFSRQLSWYYSSARTVPVPKDFHAVVSFIDSSLSHDIEGTYWVIFISL